MLYSRAAGNVAFISSFCFGLSFEMTKQFLIGILPVAKHRSMRCFQVVGLLMYCKLVFGAGRYSPRIAWKQKAALWTYSGSCRWWSLVLTCSTCLSMAAVPQWRTGLPLLLYLISKVQSSPLSAAAWHSSSSNPSCRNLFQFWSDNLSFQWNSSLW